ncbi:flagellin, partial [Yoonia sp.]|uniref:flagellin n=1 Tax=Yoonia sp. TaxID=2212373 RepID=UPI004048DCCD
MAATSASSVNKNMETAMERLSTGKRINSSADDAAGVAIASRLTSEIRGINQAIRNAGDATAMLSTGEGALNEVVNILQRMRELAVQASNDTNSATDRDNLDVEYQALEAEITRIEDSTTWAGQKLLDGTGGATGVFAFMLGTGATGTAATDAISYTFADVTTMYTAAATTDLQDLTNSKAAIVALDTAIGLVNTERAKIGATTNRIDHTISNLTNVVTNLEGGRGRIEDADFAMESTNLAKSQILQQASRECPELCVSELAHAGFRYGHALKRSS